MTSVSGSLAERLVRLVRDVGPLSASGMARALSERGTVVTDSAVTAALRRAVELGELERWPGRPIRYAIRRAT